LMSIDFFLKLSWLWFTYSYKTSSLYRIENPPIPKLVKCKDKCNVKKGKKNVGECFVLVIVNIGRVLGLIHGEPWYFIHESHEFQLWGVGCADLLVGVIIEFIVNDYVISLYNELFM
jgi:hypothetical protein